MNKPPRSAVLIVTATFLLFAPASASDLRAQTMTYGDVERLPAPPPGISSAYGEGRQQFGELRLPKGKGPFPVVVVIHGGCWYSEYDLRHVAPFAAALTETGYATWTIEYRRVGDEGGGWPGTFQDVARAADHLRALARLYPLDLKRVIAVGHSAGGELALWLAARRSLPAGSPMRSADPLRLRGVVSLAGITDMRRFRPRCGDAPARLLGGPPEGFDERYRQTSPAELLPLGVPQRLIHGAQDKIVPVELGREYEKAAKGKGEDVRLTVVDGAGHFELIAPHSSAWAAVSAALSELSDPRPRQKHRARGGAGTPKGVKFASALRDHTFLEETN
jgi:acetyl esterase/lipase